MAHILNIIPVEEDELMSSYFRRMAKANGFENALLFMQAFLWPDTILDTKQNRLIRDDGFNMLRNFNRCFGDDSSSIDFFLKTSIYSGIRPFIYNVSDIVLYVFRDNTYDINPIPKRYVLEPLYCPLCSREDIKNKGYTWLRRSHNLPGVKICHKHHCLLNVADSDDIRYVNNQLEIEYAEFATKMLCKMVDCDNQQTAEAAKTRIAELGYHIPTGGYGDFIKELMKDKRYSDFLPENTETVLKTHLHRATTNTCATTMKLLFVLFKTPDMFAKYIKPQIVPNISEFDILEYRYGLLKLRHKCGCQFILTNELFNKGWRCPDCQTKSKEKNIAEHIRTTCNNEYEVISIERSNALLKHKKCGKQIKFAFHRFIMDGCRCDCERRKPVQEVREDIEKIRGFKLISYKNINESLKIRHDKCGKVFSINYYDFIRKPYCRACLQNKVGIDVKITPRSSFRNSEKSFIHDLADIVGDEYTFVGPYEGERNYTYIRHNKCGTIGRYIPAHFRQGIRCRKCLQKTTFEGFRKYVHDLTGGEYEITKQGINRYLFIKNTNTGIEYSMLKSIIMQELNRFKPSLILPVKSRNNVNIENYAIDTIKTSYDRKTNYVYNSRALMDYIQKNFKTDDIFSIKDMSIKFAQPWLLEKSGKIKRVYNGLYTFPENNVTAIDIIKYKYYRRHGVRLGYWFGQSFAYQLGLIDKPKNIYIATRKMQQSERGNHTILGYPIVLRKAIAEVTDENYKILTFIDYVTTYKKGLRGTKRTNKALEVKALKEFLSDVERNEIEKYIDVCQDKTTLISWLDLIYGKSLLERIKTSYYLTELIHPDDLGVKDAEIDTFVKAGELKKVYNRLYAFPDVAVTYDNIVEYKYIRRHNGIIGYWYGKSFEYQIGLCEKPEGYWVASEARKGNRQQYRNASVIKCNGISLSMRKPLAHITENNVKIIAVIDYITEYGVGRMNKDYYFYPREDLDLRRLLQALQKYLDGIIRTEFEPYINIAQHQKMLNIFLDMIYLDKELETIASKIKHGSMFTSTDVGYSSSVLLAYSRTGVINHIYEDLFAIADSDISAEDVIKSRYIIQNDQIIGYWFGKSFSYYLGLIDKPMDYNIVSNNLRNKSKPGRRGRAVVSILDNSITLRNPITKITEDNYKILAVIDYTTTYRRAFYVHEHIDISTDVDALKNFLKGIPRSAFTEYESLCESRVLLNQWLNMIYGDV